MTQTSFIHVADVHLDSPLAHLRRLDATTAERLQRASRRGLENVIAAALEHRVGALVIAGDLFDGPVRDAGAGLWAESQFKRLVREGIPVVLIRGNHDAISAAGKVIRWSTDIHELAADSPQTLLLDSVGLALHGQSFGSKFESADLAAAYPAAVAGYFNVGILHTSLSGNAAHDTYAPTSVAVLESKGYDYWALGHIHQRSTASLSTRCYVGYSGNTQGRHIREAGVKGCNLVRVRDGQLAEVRFLATDSLRWHELRLDIEPVELLSDIEDVVRERLPMLLDLAEGRPLALRVRLEGASGLHSELSRQSTVEKLADTLAASLSDEGDIWLESLKVGTRPASVASTEELLQPLKYLCEVTAEARADEAVQQEMLAALDELLRKARSELAEVAWPLTDPQQQAQELDRLLHRAEDLLVSRLSAGE